MNPLQFGPDEDFDRYPRTLDADLELCAAEGVDVVFAPTADGDVPATASRGSASMPGPLGERLEGESRPGHFAGMLTVVAKLLNLHPRRDRAYFGEKDFQQLVLIRRMVADLDLPVEIVGVPIVRDADGLALSSRNRYLDADAARRRRRRSPQPSPPAEAAARHGGGAGRRPAPPSSTCSPPSRSLRLDRLDLVDADELARRSAPDVPARLLVAVYAGTTRLIDNVAIRISKD